MFVFNKMQHFPNWLFSISKDKSKTGNWEGKEEGWNGEREIITIYLFIHLFIYLLGI